jgi:hypothetical protein
MILVSNIINYSYYSIILMLPLKNIFDCCVLIWPKKMQGFSPCPKTHVFGHLLGGGGGISWGEAWETPVAAVASTLQSLSLVSG